MRDRKTDEANCFCAAVTGELAGWTTVTVIHAV